jgi:hexosaminidase
MVEHLLIPARRCRKQSGALRLKSPIVLASPGSADQVPLTQLASDLRKHKARVRIARNAWGPAAVRVRRDPRVVGRDAYRLRISPEGVEIAASEDPGAYYAVQTLRELVACHGLRLPACEIDDAPDFARRGVYHDCSRGKVPTLETLKALVERLARWKINELQLYVENVFAFARHPKIGRGFSPLSPGELLDLQDHCRLHHVRLVGSLASFGHMEKILMLPEYQHLGEMPGFHGRPGGTTLCPTDPGSIRLMSELYEEFLPLFEAEDFNVCCDETWELGRGRSKRRADRVGTGRVYLDFLLKLAKLCEKHGKRMNAWADIVLDHPELLGDLPSDVVMLNWEYNTGGGRVPRTREIAKAGLPLMVCPGTSGWQTHGTRLANAMGNIAEFATEGRKHGAEGLLNTDWGDRGHRNTLGVSLHAFAYGAAQAWNGRAVDDKVFTDRFAMHVFGDRRGKLAKAIRTLGRSYLDCGATYSNHSALYLTLVQPTRRRRGVEQDLLDQAKPAGLRKIITGLRDPAIWPKPTPGMDRFERLALREFALASRMDVLASRRTLIVQDLRAGRSVAPSALRALASEMGRLMRDFESLWLARNKPSRLRDNLSLMQKVQREALRQARK